MQLVEKYKPETLDQFAGLDRPRAILKQFAASPYSSAWLLIGPSGLGKTTMALALAKQIGGEVHHIPSRSCDLATVEEVAARCHYFPWSGKWHFVLVDEADQMSRPAQHAFLSKLDTTAAPENTIFLFTANATGSLEDRFISRCRVLNFSHDGLLGPACDLLAEIWRKEAPPFPAPNFEAMLRAANFNIRQAIMDLELATIAGCCAPRNRAPSVSERGPAPSRSRLGLQRSETGPQEPVSTKPLTANLDAYAVAALLRINVATLYNRVKMGRVPAPNRDGRKMTWDRSLFAEAS